MKVKGELAGSLEDLKKMLKAVRKLNGREYSTLQKQVKPTVLEAWSVIESSFDVTRKKYGEEEE